jgi:hypothetical protein
MAEFKAALNEMDRDLHWLEKEKMVQEITMERCVMLMKELNLEH